METPSLAALLAHYRNDIYRLALRLVGNRADAEDIVQESLLQAWRSISSFKGKAGIRTWLYRIAMNAARMHRRAARRRPTESLQEVLPDFDQTVSEAMTGRDPGWIARADEVIEQRQSAHRVRAALQAISEKHGVILVLRDLQDGSTEEVSRKLGISPANVRQRLLRARRALRHRLEEIDRQSCAALPDVRDVHGIPCAIPRRWRAA